MDMRKALCKPHLALSETKLAQPPSSAAHPVQNSPSRPARRPTRYKTLPARPKTLISAHFSRAGRTFYRFRHQQPEQGELFAANHHSPAAQSTHTGTKLPGHTACKAKPVQNSPGNPHLKATTGTKLSPHSEKRPFQTIWREQGENYPGPDTKNPSRENLFPQTTTHEPRSAHAPVQNSPGTRRVRPNRYKTLPAHGV